MLSYLNRDQGESGKQPSSNVYRIFDSDRVFPESEKEKMNVLVVSRSSFAADSNQGGADKHALKLALSLGALKENVMVAFVGRPYDELRENGIKVVEVRSPRSMMTRGKFRYYLIGFALNFTSAVTALRFLSRKKGIKVVSAHSNISAILTKMLSGNTKVIYRIHDPLYSSHNKEDFPIRFIRLVNNYLLERVAIRMSDYLIVTSPFTYKQIPEKYRNKTEQMFAPVEFDSSSEAKTFTAYPGLPSRYAASVGYQNSRKRFDHLIRLWLHMPEDMHLVLIGNGPEQGKLIDLAGRLNLSDRVHFLGYLNHDSVERVLRGATMGILASERENFPTSIIESLKNGTPSVYVTRDPPGYYDAISSEFLLITDDWDLKSLSRKIVDFTANNQASGKSEISV